MLATTSGSRCSEGSAAEEAYEIDWNFEPEPGGPGNGRATARLAVLNLEELERTSLSRAAVVSAPAGTTISWRRRRCSASTVCARRRMIARGFCRSIPPHVGAKTDSWCRFGSTKASTTRPWLAPISSDAWPKKGRTRASEIGCQIVVKAGFRVEGEEVVALPAPAPKKKDKISALLDDLEVKNSRTSARRAAKSDKFALPAEVFERRGVDRRTAAAVVPGAPEEPGLPAAKAPADTASELSAEPWHAGLHDAGHRSDDELPEIVIPIQRPPKSARRRRQLRRQQVLRSLSRPPQSLPSRRSRRRRFQVEDISSERIAADESLSWLDQAVVAPATPGRPMRRSSSMTKRASSIWRRSSSRSSRKRICSPRRCRRST